MLGIDSQPKQHHNTNKSLVSPPKNKSTIKGKDRKKEFERKTNEQREKKTNNTNNKKKQTTKPTKQKTKRKQTRNKKQSHKRIKNVKRTSGFSPKIHLFTFGQPPSQFSFVSPCSQRILFLSFD